MSSHKVQITEQKNEGKLLHVMDYRLLQCMIMSFVGTYQLERATELLDVNVHMKSPFDPQHQRIHGIYSGCAEFRRS